MRPIVVSAASCIAFGAAMVSWSSPARTAAAEPPLEHSAPVAPGPPAQAASPNLKAPPKDIKDPPKSDAPPLDTPLRRRGGFTFGVSGYALSGRAAGYPNSLTQIGDPDWRYHVVGVGGGFSLWLGGSLTDWFTFAIGWDQSRMTGKSLESGAWDLFFRVEAFPFISLGGWWQDVGVSADFGTGPSFIRHKGYSNNLAHAGTVSVARFGVFWEAWRPCGGRFAVGPSALFQYEGSDSMSRTFGGIGFRAAFYGAR